MILRPGNLSNFHGMTPKMGRGVNISLLGGFAGGKSDYEPPPAPPPSATATPAQLKTVQLSPTISYKQDTRCPRGELMATVACVGADCDPGEKENDCVDDARYDALMDQIEDVKEEKEDKKSPLTRLQQLQQKRDSGAYGGKTAALAAKHAEELKALEDEHEEVEEIVAQAPMMQPPGAYTGGGMPIALPRRARKKRATDEDKIAALVSAHEIRKAMQRSSSPTQAPPPRRPVSAPEPITSPPILAPAPKPKNIGGMFSWLRNTLFGAPRVYDFDGLGEESSNTKIIIPIIVGLGLLMVLKGRS